MKVVLGSDHAGFELRGVLAEWLRSRGHEVEEVGAVSLDAFDYPDASDALVRRVRKTGAPGVLICGTGIGVSIRANRYRDIRAALCCSPETAALARQHNDANVVCIGARTTSLETAQEIVDVFLKTAASSEPRHMARVSKLDQPLLSDEVA